MRHNKFSKLNLWSDFHSFIDVKGEGMDAET